MVTRWNLFGKRRIAADAFFLDQIISIASATPWLPPMHNVTMPRLQPSRFIESIKRVASTAPLALIG